MRLQCTRVMTLPRLAWCARVTAGASVVEVLHGDWVETWPHAFCEGAWDGPFEVGDFAAAATFMGSGGRVTPEGLLLAAPTHVMARLYTIETGGRLLASNSLVFLLAQTGDALDLDHSRYYFDFLRHKRRGLTRPTAFIVTAGGRCLHCHHHTNLLVRPDLSWSTQPKPPGPAPGDFESYRDLLQTGVARTVQNAAHPGRRQRYRPLATLSQGYDAPAVATLVARAGATEALVCRLPARPGEPEEDGSLLVKPLGLTPIPFDGLAFRARADAPEAEFCAGMAYGNNVPLSVVERELTGALLCTGHPGDDIWATDPRMNLPDLQVPTDRRLEGSALAEYRLRVGFVWFPVPWIGAQHKSAIFRITSSAEMRPWSIAGRYNRPIPRRIAEEAGVARALFGHVKMATFHCNLDRPDAMSEGGRTDFEAFYQSRVRVREDRHVALLRAGASVDAVLLRALGRLPHRLYVASLPLTRWAMRDLRHPHWWSAYLYTFHWGCERVRSRYTPAFPSS